MNFFTVAPGAHIRPFQWPMFLIFLTTVGLILVVPFAARACFVERRWFGALLAVAFTLLPLPIGIAMLHFASRLIGFTLAQ